jgi:hypothetical protein
MVLNEIKLKLVLSPRFLNVLVCLKKCLYFIRVSSCLHLGANIVKEELQVQVPLIRLGPQTITNLGLQDHKSSLGVFSGCLLCLCKFSFSSVLRSVDRWS